MLLNKVAQNFSWIVLHLFPNQLSKLHDINKRPLFNLIFHVNASSYYFSSLSILFLVNQIYFKVVREVIVFFNIIALKRNT